MDKRQEEARKLERDWAQDPRWQGVKRGYSAADVVRLRGSIADRAHARAARRGEALALMHERPFVHSLGALTGNQAVQQVKAGVPAIYLSGWQVAADANDSLQMYPDQSLYAVSSVPTVVKRINNALARADQIQWMEGKGDIGLLRTDRRGRRIGLRRRAERLRADEDDDRCRRRRRALRGPARLRQEMRPHGRQGAGAHAGSGAEAHRRAPRGRRDGRAHGAARAHRRGSRRHRHHRRRRERQAVPHRRAHFRGLLPHAQGLRPGALARPRLCANTPTWCGARPARRTSSSPGNSPKASAEVPGARCSPTTARRRSTGSATSTTRRSPSSSASSAPWATSSSSSRWPASTRSTTRCSSWRTATRATT